MLILLVLYMTKHNRIKSKNTTSKLRKKKSYRKSILGRQITRKTYLHKTSTADIDYVLDVCVNESPVCVESADTEPELCLENEAESDPKLETDLDLELCEPEFDLDSEDQPLDNEIHKSSPSYVESLRPLKPVLNSKSLFQVSIHPGQFTDIDCFQTLFGLEKHVSTTEWSEAANYIQQRFELQDGQVKHSWYPGTFSTPILFSEKINKQLQQLDDNFATILTLKIMSSEPLKMWGHYVVAYKSGHIYYFDPQNNIHSTNPLDLSQKPNTVIRFGMFYVKDVP